MIAYEFYWLDPKGGYKIMGTLPERRKESARITQESIKQWGKTIFNKKFYPKKIYIRKVVMDEQSGRVVQPLLFTMFIDF